MHCLACLSACMALVTQVKPCWRWCIGWNVQTSMFSLPGMLWPAHEMPALSCREESALPRRHALLPGRAGRRWRPRALQQRQLSAGARTPFPRQRLLPAPQRCPPGPRAPLVPLQCLRAQPGHSGRPAGQLEILQAGCYWPDIDVATAPEQKVPAHHAYRACQKQNPGLRFPGEPVLPAIPCSAPH